MSLLVYTRITHSRQCCNLYISCAVYEIFRIIGPILAVDRVVLLFNALILGEIPKFMIANLALRNQKHFSIVWSEVYFDILNYSGVTSPVWLWQTGMDGWIDILITQLLIRSSCRFYHRRVLISLDRKDTVKFWKSSASRSESRNFMKDSSTFNIAHFPQFEFLHNLVFPKKTDGIFVNMLPET